MTKTVAVNKVVEAYKAVRKVVSKAVEYPKVRLYSIDRGEKGYPVPFKGAEDGLFDRKHCTDHQEIIASILRSSIDGSIIAVVIGRVDMKSRDDKNNGRWIWCKSLSSEMVKKVDQGSGFEAVELKSDPTNADIIAIDFYDQDSGASVILNFNSLTGKEIVV
jgi:hypothetical protein